MKKPYCTHNLKHHVLKGNLYNFQLTIKQSKMCGENQLANTTRIHKPVSSVAPRNHPERRLFLRQPPGKETCSQLMAVWHATSKAKELKGGGRPAGLGLGLGAADGGKVWHGRGRLGLPGLAWTINTTAAWWPGSRPGGHAAEVGAGVEVGGRRAARNKRKPSRQVPVSWQRQKKGLAETTMNLDRHKTLAETRGPRWFQDELTGKEAAKSFREITICDTAGRERH